MPSYVTYHIFAATVQRVTSDSVAHIASSYPAAYRWARRDRTRWRPITRRSRPRCADWQTASAPNRPRRCSSHCAKPPLHRTTRLHSRMYLDSARTMRSAA